MFVRSMALQHLGKVHQLLTIFGQDVGHARTVEAETHIQCRHGGRFDHRRRDSRLLDGGCNDLLGLALGGQFFSLFRQIFSNLDIGAGMSPAALANLVAGVHQFHLGTRQTCGGTLHAFGILTDTGMTCPEIVTQAACIIDQRRLADVRILTGLQLIQDALGLCQRSPGEAATIIARVFVEAHIQPALSLGQRIVAQANAFSGIEFRDARLRIPIDALVTGNLRIFHLLERRVGARVGSHFLARHRPGNLCTCIRTVVGLSVRPGAGSQHQRQQDGGRCAMSA